MTHFTTESLFYHYVNEAIHSGISRNELLELVGPVAFDKTPVSASSIYLEKLEPLFRALYDIGYQKNIELTRAGQSYMNHSLHNAYFGNAPDMLTFIKLFMEMCQRHSSSFGYEIQSSSGFATIYIDYLNRKQGIHSPQCFYVTFIMMAQRIFDLDHAEGGNILSGFTQHKIPDPDNFSLLTGCGIKYNENRDFIRFPSSMLELKNKNFNPLVVGFLTEQYHQHYGIGSNKDKLIIDISSHLNASWGQENIANNIEVIAEKLGMSRSKLYRELAKRNMTFSTIVESQRKQYAMTYVKNPNTSIAEISDRLGYANVSAFTRAFNRWFNVNPSKMRQ
jgi:AraC-like DNA-binding protein